MLGIVMLPFALIVVAGALAVVVSLLRPFWNTDDEKFSEAACNISSGEGFLVRDDRMENCIPSRFGPGTKVADWRRYARGGHLVSIGHSAAGGLESESYLGVYDYEKGPDRYRIDVTHKSGVIRSIEINHWQNHWQSGGTRLPVRFEGPGDADKRDARFRM